MTRIGVAVVGLGVGRKHLEAYAALREQYEVRAVCDTDPARAAAAARDFGVARVEASLERLFDDPAITLVDLCTPPQLHLAQMAQVLAAGCDVLCEKPLVVSLDQLDTLERLQAASGRRVFPVFQVRWGRGFAQLRALQAAGHAQHALVATVETHWRRDDDYYATAWRGHWASEHGGVCLTQAIHAHDLLTQALGPVAEVYASLATRARASIEVEDCAAITLRLRSGALATLSATLGAAGNHSRLRFVFADLTVTSAAPNPYRPGEAPWHFEARSPAAQAGVDAVLRGCPPAREGFEGQLLAVHTALAGALQNGTPAPVTLADAREALELVSAIYHSAENGQPVALPLPPGHPRRAGWAPAAGGFARGFAGDLG